MATTLKQSKTTDPSPSPPSFRPNWPTIVPFLIACVLLGAVSWPVLKFWWWEYTMPDSYYSHGPVIPLLVALMLWYRRDALQAVPKAPALPALIVLIPALCLLVFAAKTEIEFFESVGLLLTIWSSVWLVLGPRFLRAAAFPLGFLALMAPLPGPILNDATLRIQMLSTVLANKLLHVFGFHTQLNGNIIQMDNFMMNVEVACSGFKLSHSILTFGAAFAYLTDGPARKRLLIFLFSLPLGLVINTLRIALVGVVGECMGASAGSTFHDWSGVLTLTLGFVGLFSLAKALGCRKFAGWPIF